MTIDVDAFVERAAIIEYDGGFSRFEAETLAAKAQGKSRREALDEVRIRNSQRGRNNRSMARQPRQDNMPRVQPREAQEK